MESPRIFPAEVNSVERTRGFIDARKESNKSQEQPEPTRNSKQSRNRMRAESAWHGGICYFKENGVSAGYSEGRHFDSGSSTT